MVEPAGAASWIFTFKYLMFHLQDVHRLRATLRNVRWTRCFCRTNRCTGMLGGKDNKT